MHYACDHYREVSGLSPPPQGSLQNAFQWTLQHPLESQTAFHPHLPTLNSSCYANLLYLRLPSGEVSHLAFPLASLPASAPAASAASAVSAASVPAAVPATVPAG